MEQSHFIESISHLHCGVITSRSASAVVLKFDIYHSETYLPETTGHKCTAWALTEQDVTTPGSPCTQAKPGLLVISLAAFSPSNR